MFSQFAHELRCLYCGKPNPATEWRAAGDLVPFYCQREPGKHNLTITCPHCQRAWYVVWDENPGAIQNLLQFPASGPAADASATDANQVVVPTSSPLSDDEIVNILDEPEAAAGAPKEPAATSSVNFCDAIVQAENPEDMIDALSSSAPSVIEVELGSIEVETYGHFIEAAKRVCPWITLGRILVAYDAYRAKSDEWRRLPEALDHERCWEALHKRLLPLVQRNTHATVIQKDAFDLAMDLMSADRDDEALDYLLAARPGFARDHEFWIFACMYNLVSHDHPRADREALVAQGEAIEAGDISVPDTCRQEVRKGMRRLRSGVGSQTAANAGQDPAPETSAGPGRRAETRHIRFTCPKCGKKVRAPKQAGGKAAQCPGCRNKVVVPPPQTISEEDILGILGVQADASIASNSAKQATRRLIAPGEGTFYQYGEGEVPKDYGLCSDRQCPCPEVKIPKGSGYLYISAKAVRNMIFRIRSEETGTQPDSLLDSFLLGRGMSITLLEMPVLVCEQGAKLRGIDLAVAAADARLWWETGKVRLRPTPMAKREKSPRPVKRADQKGPADRADGAISTESASDDSPAEDPEPRVWLFFRQVRCWMRCTDGLVVAFLIIFLLLFALGFAGCLTVLVLGEEDSLIGLVATTVFGLLLCLVCYGIYFDIQRVARGITVLCVCKGCGMRYILGVNAVVTTLGPPESSLGPRHIRDIASPPTDVPDTVGLKIGKASWPEGRFPPPPSRPYSAEISLSKGLRALRTWRCANCNTVQEYDWWAGPFTQSDGRRESITRGGAEQPESYERRALVRTAAPLGKLAFGGWMMLCILSVFPGTVLGVFVVAVLAGMLGASEDDALGFMPVGALIPPIAFLFTYATSYISLSVRSEKGKITFEKKQRLMLVSEVDTGPLDDQFGIVVGPNPTEDAAVRLVDPSGRTVCTIYDFLPWAIHFEVRHIKRISDALRVPVRYKLSEPMARVLSTWLGRPRAPV